MCSPQLSLCLQQSTGNHFIIDRQMDFLCLMETWLTGTDEDNVVHAALLLDDYTMTDARGGGQCKKSTFSGTRPIGPVP
jgi:hypothetical protein